MAQNNNFGTFVITDKKIVISKADGIKVIAMKLIAGAATYRGTQYIAATGGDSIPLSLVINESTIISSKKNIDSLIIDASVGTGNIVQIITSANIN